ncbi:MAG: ATP-binding protein [Acidimicrobiia bacterium]
MTEVEGMPEAEERKEKLFLRWGGRLVQHLGAQLYPSATATVAELISNAWDANARNVWVSMPFGDWADGQIVVVDDGHGMNFEQARDYYLLVGDDRRRRTTGQRTEDGKRLAHGRKGIGKLAAFGTATILELRTRREGEDDVAFRLDYDKIRAKDPTEPYEVEESEDAEDISDPEGNRLAHGTRVRLTGLRLKRRLDEDRFVQSMSRRFALNDAEMRVLINGRPLGRYALDVQFRFPPDALPAEAKQDGDWAVETLEGDREVRWWMGFTRKPLDSEGEQGISILARGKLVQAPFVFRRYQGTEGQLGQEYLIGEVIANWLDPEEPPQDGSEVDYITSNRDALQLEDEELEPFVDWGRRRVAWALTQRNRLRVAEADLLLDADPRFRGVLEEYPAVERVPLRRIATELLRLEVERDGLADVLERIADVRTDQIVRQAIEEADRDLLSGPALWDVAHRLAPVNARSLLQTVRSRVILLERLVDEPAPEPERLVRLLAASPWLLGEAWDAASSTDISTRIRIEGRDGAAALVVDATEAALGLPPAPELDTDPFRAHLRRSLNEHRDWLRRIGSREDLA